MQVTELLAADIPRTDGVGAAPAPSPSRASPLPLAHSLYGPWTLILAVGGTCWVVVGIAAMLWMQPWAGTTTAAGDYVISSAALVVQHVLVFIMAAAPAYRVAIAHGWPEGALARTRVLALNVLLVLLVSAWSDVVLALVGGFVDGHMADMRDTFIAMEQVVPDLKLVAGALQFFLLPYVLGLCAIALVMAMGRQHREALRTAELARAYDAARLAMLSAQLQPHFLFNALHAAMALIDESPRQAASMLARLGDFLRHALETSGSPWVEVATELEGLEAYLAVQQARFAGRLNIAIEASPESLGVYLPSMLLQPLAENAIEHGRSEGGPALRLRIAASVAAEHLRIVVNNSSSRLAADLTPADYGVGLSNVDLRLRAAYGNAAQLAVGPDRQGGTSATLVLPVRRRPAPAGPGGAPG
jgi:histidine kinase